ncbi:MAG TPA: type II toxin-antitoxin system HicA family toxin [Thermoleophilia bacterium]|nr:type II toxin-antitoxin system HicA family toxin [Thermoleophilia bacterium]
MLRAMRRAGWEQREQHGSHIQLKHPTKPGRVTIPVHSGKTLPPHVLRNILDAAGLSVEEFLNLL